jgi:thiol-disulfide isomerase/thioredoxin
LRSIRCILALVCLVLASSGALAQDAAQIAPPVGHQELIKQISQAKGRVVLVNFWATWCQPCRLELPELMRLRGSYGDDKLLIIGVSMDQDPAMLVDFALKSKINYPIFLAKPDVGMAFNVRGIPKTLIYAQNGEQVLNHDGYIPEAMLREIMGKLLGG